MRLRTKSKRENVKLQEMLTRRFDRVLRLTPEGVDIELLKRLIEIAALRTMYVDYSGIVQYVEYMLLNGVSYQEVIRRLNQ